MANQPNGASTNSVIIPDTFKNTQMASAFQALDADNLSDGISQSYGVISIRSKAWALRYQGQTKAFIRSDGGPSPHIDVVILGAGKGKSKSYYRSYNTNSDGERPLCASIDGTVPDADVREQQSDTCALCERNKWKMQPSGRMGRECTDYKRLAVLILPSMTTPILGFELMEPVFLRVPPDSLKPLAEMGDAMDRAGHKYFSFVTRISFDPTKTHARLLFKPIQALSDKEAPAIIELRNDPMVVRIIGGDAIRGAEPVTVMQPAGTVPTGIASMPNNPAAYAVPPGVGMTNNPNPIPAPSGNGTSSGASGDDLDKRIAALLSK